MQGPLESEPNIARTKVHRFFESYHSLPLKIPQALTSSQLDHKILLECGNLYSLFDLIVFIKNNLACCQCPDVYFRRLMVLIFAICEDCGLYYSKIRALGNFWWQACLTLRYFYAKNRKDEGQDYRVNQFRTTLQRQEFLYQCLRCFMALMRSNSYEGKYESLEEERQVRANVEETVKALKQEMLDHREETQFKILLGLEYGNFLLLVFKMRRQDPSPLTTEALFHQFCQSLSLILRLLKKFYSLTIPKYRSQFLQLLNKAKKQLAHQIPAHKYNILLGIINFMNRKQEKKEKQEKIVASYEKQERRGIVGAAVYLMSEWKRIVKENSGKEIEKKGLKQQLQAFIEQKTIKKQYKLPKQPSQSNLQTVRLIKQLKRKRSFSLNKTRQKSHTLYSTSFAQINDQFCRAVSKIRTRIHSASSLKKNKEIENSKVSALKYKQTTVNNWVKNRKVQTKVISLRLNAKKK